MSSSAHLSKELHDFIKSIGETRSKQEEDKIIQNEVIDLKPKLAEKNITPKKMKELLIRALYIQMLGQNADFAHIHAVNLTQNKNLTLKRIGYLLCSLFFNQQSQLLIMLISTIQKDLVSSNIHEVVICLTALSKLMNQMIATAVCDSVLKLISHQTDLVRKKAILVTQKMQIVYPGFVSQYNEKMKKALCDRQPSVMAAALNLYHHAVSQNPTKFKQLTPSFVIILKQVIEHKLPKEFDYHRVPAPWIQIKLLQLLALLGKNDQKTSEHAYQIVGQALRRAEDSTINIGFALTYQCLKTIAQLYPQQSLLEDAASTLAKFLSSTSNNLKYMGIRLLSDMFKTYPKILNDHQLIVVDCLESKDETLKKQTLELLYKMTNGSNIEVITKRMLSALHSSTDPYFRETLVNKIVELCERFAPSHEWYIQTMHILFEFGSQYITEIVLNNYLKIVYDNYKENQEFGRLIIESNMELLTRVSPTDFIVKMVSWIFGEIGSAVHAQDSEKLSEITQVLIDSLQLDYEDKTTKGWVLNSLAKLSSCKGFQKHAEVKAILQSNSSTVLIQIYQRALEYRKLAKYNAALRISNDVKFDKNMSFLSGFVETARRQGAKQYQTPIINPIANDGGIRFAPYGPKQGHPVAKNNNLTEDSGIKVPLPNLWDQTGYAKQLKKETPAQTKANINIMTGISNSGNSFGSEQLNNNINNSNEPYVPKEKPKQIDQKKIQIANSLFGPVTTPQPPKFKGPQSKPKPQQTKPVNTKPVQQPQQQPVTTKATNKPNKKVETADLIDLL